MGNGGKGGDLEGKERGGSSRGEGAEADYREWQAHLQTEEKEPVGRKFKEMGRYNIAKR